jgi:hypothetical protein
MDKDTKLKRFVENEGLKRGTVTHAYKKILEFLYRENLEHFSALDGLKYPRGYRTLISSQSEKVYNPDEDYQKPLHAEGDPQYYFDIRNLVRRPQVSMGLILRKLGYSDETIQGVCFLFDSEERKRVQSEFTKRILRVLKSI